MTLTHHAEFEHAVDAIITGDVVTLEGLLRQYPTLIKARSEKEHHATLLHYIAANGVEDERQQVPSNSVDIARLLLTSGAEVDATAEMYRGGAGTTPLVLLVSSSHPARANLQTQLVELFCRFGAKVNGVADDGLPMATALAFGYLPAARQLADCGARVDNLVFAAALGKQDVVRQYLDDVQPYHDPFGVIHTDPERVKALALAAAALSGDVHVAQMLADANLNDEVATPLHVAVKHNHDHMVRFLLERGADVALPDHEGFTALHWAAWQGHIHLMNVLIAHDADLEAKNKYGDTVLDCTVWGACNSHAGLNNYLGSIQHLLEAGADVVAVSPYPCGKADIDELLATYRTRS